MFKIQALITLFAFCLLCSCQDDTAVPEEERIHFVSVTPVNELSVVTLRLYASFLGRPELADRMKYSIGTYKLVYKTTYNGTTVNASGLLYLPKGMVEDAAPLISVQHGTTFVKDEAPSVSGEYSGVELFASAGYIALMPDFIGYGESANIFHPYYDKEHSAGTVIDMVKAAQEYLQQQKIAFSGKLFLAGYSEGGYVTMAAAHTIETTDTGLTVTAVAAGAGGYDLSGMLSDVTSSNYYSYPSYLAFILMAYNHTYQWNKPLDYFFSKSYADALNKYMNGQYSGSFINSKLTTSADQLFDTQFFESLKTFEGEPTLKQALKDNSVSGWETQIPMRLFHGTSDEVIPYHNSQVTVQNFKSFGSSDVTLTLIPEGTHGSTFLPMLEVIVPWFEELR